MYRDFELHTPIRSDHMCFFLYLSVRLSFCSFIYGYNFFKQNHDPTILLYIKACNLHLETHNRMTWSGMEGKPILSTKGYNGLSTPPLVSVSTPSIQNGTHDKESSRDGIQVRTNFLVVQR